MKRIHFAIAIIFISILNLNCQKDFRHAGSATTTVDNNVKAPISATLQGNILDEDGQPAAGVQVMAGSKTAITDAHGYFRIIDAPLDRNASVVTAERAGYFKAFRTFGATSGVNQIVIKLLKKTLAGSVDAVAGGEVSFSNDAKISLPSNAIVKDQDGSPYTGAVSVYASYIDPTAADIREIIPGSFMANDKNNKRVSLTSYGMMAVMLESASGEKLQIAKGLTARLTAPIPSSIQAAAPSTISLWYIDEQTGIWKEEGSATKSGSSYVGEVKHFSFWNYDFSDPSINVSLTIKNSKGLPLVYTAVMITSINNGHAYGYTDSLGQVSGLVPADENLTLHVLDQCGTDAYSENIGPFNQNTDLGDITVGATVSSVITVEGKLLNCSNVAVTDGYAIIYLDNIPRYASTNSNGEFSTSFVICAGNTTSCDILGVDNDASQQGTIVNTLIAAPVTSAGNVSACGTSALEFVDYNLDGITYHVAKPGSDSLFAFSTAGPGSGQSFTAYVAGYKSGEGINFSFINNGAAGIFPLNNLLVMGMNNTGLILPFTVNVTGYPQNTGDFFEGNFTGQFRDSANLTPLHSISCSFRVRKY